MSNIHVTQSASVGLSKILRIMSTGKGRVTMLVKGVGDAGIHLRHVQGQKASNDNGASLTRILAINSILNRLTSTQKEHLKNLFEDMTQGKKTKSEFFDVLRKIAINKNNGSEGQNAIANGLVLNVLA